MARLDFAVSEMFRFGRSYLPYKVEAIGMPDAHAVCDELICYRRTPD